MAEGSRNEGSHNGGSRDAGLVVEEVARALGSWAMVRPGDLVVVGVSGGPDSVALLLAMDALARRFDYGLVVAHLNHMFRGAEAEEDAGFVTGLAGRLDLPCVVRSIDVPAAIRGEPEGEAARDVRGLSPEEAARKIRLDFLARVAADRGARRIALGHNRDDQAETVLMRFIRGTGLTGLAGIPPVRLLDARAGAKAPSPAAETPPRDSAVTIIRPLLGVARSQIEEYLDSLGITPRRDSSNMRACHLRNRLRLELIPHVERDYNPAFLVAISRMAELLREDEDFMDRQAQEAFQCCSKGLEGRRRRLSVTGLRRLHPALARRVVRKALEEAGTLKDVEVGHVEAIMRLVRGASGGERRLCLPGDCEVVRRYSDLLVGPRPGAAAAQAGPPRKGPYPPPGRTLLPTAGRIELAELGLAVSARVVATGPDRDPGSLIAQARDGRGLTAVLDVDATGPDLWVRTRARGDRFWPLGAPGSGKLKEFFIDRKVPASLRDSVALVECPTGIAWVVGHEIAEPYKVGCHTARVLLLDACPMAAPRAGGQ